LPEGENYREREKKHPIHIPVLVERIHSQTNLASPEWEKKIALTRKPRSREAKKRFFTNSKARLQKGGASSNQSLY